VDGDRVYFYGAVGDLLCLRATDGEVVWKLNARRDYQAELPTWGFASAPLVVDDRLIVLLGGSPDAKVVALDKLTGKELWRALSGDTEPGYAPPFLIEAGGRRQVIQWTPQALHSLDPETGAVFWSQPFSVNFGLSVATPVLSAHGLLISSFYNGSRMYRLHPDRPEAELIWKGNSDSEIDTDGLHSLVTTPVVAGDHLYGVGSYGALRGLDARTGKRIWETHALTRENARWASAQIVRHGDRYFINNDRGELILARLTPEGLEEIDRTPLLEPTQPSRRRRELGKVLWVHPAYANRSLIVRNDEEIVRFSMEQ
jgi:outer membrane protein assembly factor BamB